MRIGKRLQFIGTDLVSDYDKDHIEHATYIAKFTDRHGNLFGHFDYDYFDTTKPMTCDKFDRGWWYHIYFRPTEIKYFYEQTYQMFKNPKVF